jgi:N-acetylglucosaminyldiphosphoundecaprenol N-acetyl-beta-D-mannosaminyltransferase
MNHEQDEAAPETNDTTGGPVFPTQWVGSIEFAAASPEQAAESVLQLANARRRTHIHLANAYTTALADKSVEYRALLLKPSLNFPDGKPVGWASKMKRHRPHLQQVRGPQLFLDVFAEGRRSNVRHFLLGSTPDVLTALQQNLESKYPGVEIVGVESPPFRPLTDNELAAQDDRIRRSGAHIVWVGLGTPKQDFEAARLSEALPIVAVAVGAAFDFTAGTLKEAPDWVSKVGLEWMYRFSREPRRLWKRYIFGNTRFLKAALFSPPKTVPRQSLDTKRR